MSQQAEPLRGPHFVVTTEGEIHGQDTDENREIVRRIHACINACDGISTEELEKGIVQDMQRVIAQLVPMLKGQAGGDGTPQTNQDENRRVVVRNQPINARPLQDA